MPPTGAVYTIYLSTLNCASGDLPMLDFFEDPQTLSQASMLHLAVYQRADDDVGRMGTRIPRFRRWTSCSSCCFLPWGV